MVAINTVPVQTGDNFSTKYEGTVTTVKTDYVFPSVQDTIFVNNYNYEHITATVNGKSVRIGPGSVHRFTEDSDTISLQSSYGNANFMIEGRSFPISGGGAGVDTVARAELAQKITLGDLSESGRKIKTVAGVIRNDGTGWKFIESANGTANHEKLNLLSVTADATQITVNFNFTAKNVLSFVATPDETFAQKGYFCGPSVG